MSKVFLISFFLTLNLRAETIQQLCSLASAEKTVMRSLQQVDRELCDLHASLSSTSEVRSLATDALAVVHSLQAEYSVDLQDSALTESALSTSLQSIARLIGHYYSLIACILYYYWTTQARRYDTAS